MKEKLFKKVKLAINYKFKALKDELRIVAKVFMCVVIKSVSI